MEKRQGQKHKQRWKNYKQTVEDVGINMKHDNAQHMAKSVINVTKIFAMPKCARATDRQTTENTGT